MMSVVPGNIIVPMTRPKRSRRPGKRKRARQKASAVAMKAAMSTVSIVTAALFRKF